MAIPRPWAATGGVFMDFLELYSSLKKDNKICIVRLGAFFVIVGSDAMRLNKEIGLKLTCFSSGICKVGFPERLLMANVTKLKLKEMGYEVYDYADNGMVTNLKFNSKYYTKVAEYEGEEFKKKYEMKCEKCKYKMESLIKEIASLEKRRFEKEMYLKSISQKGGMKL